MIKTTALVVAGGSGLRFGTDQPKQYLALGGISILQRSLELFQRIEQVTAIYAVVPHGDVDTIGAHVDLPLISKFRGAVEGGLRRQDSVKNGLEAIQDNPTLVAVHDAVRPLANPDLIRKTILQAERCGAAIMAAPASDTLKMCDENQTILSTLERSIAWHAQTPQIFRLDWLRAAYRHIENNGIEITDESQAFELAGHPVSVVESPHTNIKITTPQDLACAEWLLQKQSA